MIYFRFYDFMNVGNKEIQYEKYPAKNCNNNNNNDTVTVSKMTVV